MAFAPLFELNDQFQAKNGHNLTGGFLRVYLAYTDDHAETYSDYIGTRNPRDIVIDDNGRAVVICDSSKAYRLEVYDSEGMLLWTEEPVFCTGTGGGGGSGTATRIESTDQSISVESATVGSVTTYDLAIAPDTKDMLEWVTAERQANADGALVPFYVDGTMEIDNTSGLFLQANELYHVTNSFTVTPTGTGIAYDTLTVKLMLDSTELCSRSFDIDSSLTDPVECEFSYDVSTTADGYLYWIVSGTSAFTQTMAKMQVHRIYSGLAAVPSTYATKAYVDSGLSSKISYSALEYSTANQITAISGSAIGAAGVDPNEFVPWSASGVFQPSADMSSYVPVSAIEGNGGQVTGISGSAIRGHEYSGIWPVIVDNTADTISVEDKTLAVDETMTGYESAGSAVIGVNTGVVLSGLTAYQPASAMSAYAYESSLSSKLDTTAFSTVSGDFLTSHQSLAGYATESYVDSSVSGKLDATASSQFLTSLPADLAYTSDVASAVSSKLDASASSDFYPMSGNPSGFLTAHQSLAGYATVEYVDSSVSSKLDSSAYDSAWFAPASGMSAYAYESSLSSKLDATASSMFQPSGNYQPSGDYAFNSALSAYQPVSGMTAYAPSGDYADNSALDSKLDASASSEFYLTSNPSGFITGIDLSDYQLTADMSAYQLSGDFAYNSSLADYQPTSAMTAYQLSGDYAYTSALADYQPVSAMSAYQPSGDYADASSLSAKLDASASSSFYPADNPSGFVTGIDLSDYQLTADMSSYQQTSAMSAYALSADVSGCIDTVSTNSASWAAVTLPITGSIGADSAIYGETSVEFTRNDTVGEPDIRTATLTPEYLNITYTVDNNDFYSVNLNETGIEFSDPDGFYTISPYEITTWNSASDAVANNSATWDGVTAKQDASAMSAYQEVSGMTAYQPAGTYIYESALGWAEV